MEKIQIQNFSNAEFLDLKSQLNSDIEKKKNSIEEGAIGALDPLTLTLILSNSALLVLALWITKNRKGKVIKFTKEEKNKKGEMTKTTLEIECKEESSPKDIMKQLVKGFKLPTSWLSDL